MSRLLRIGEEVQAALAEGRPVVALESTVIAHGLPWPDSLEATQEMLEAVRSAGAVPAVVGVTAGRLVVGLDEAVIERFAKHGRQVIKVSRRDLARALTEGCDGATTVASTMIAAEMAGIRIFGTGGIGGVHRSAEGQGDSFDVSADLYELGRTPVCVVSSGAKSILDLPRTLEVLESLGTPVIGYGTDSFPTFYSRDATLPITTRVDSAEQSAALLHAHWELGLGGVLLANPVPESAALPTQTVEAWLEEALAAAQAEGVAGPQVTPFLLAHLHRRSEGQTLKANRALLIDNARVAAQVAASYSQLS
ncbi:pseudouridine-5'-phosphate glycosidase [Aquibaculum sediminis]|uniref:pseudouridine-5'-phosphate glycosidase n=1 Tax=Aquibaculum sediminis TaxID=3231907 RepID=UPI0034521609